MSANPSVDPRDIKRVESQADRLLARLRQGPITNVEAVVELRILNMTARVSELRQDGHNVVATRGAGGVWTYELRPAREPEQLNLIGGA